MVMKSIKDADQLSGKLPVILTDLESRLKMKWKGDPWKLKSIKKSTYLVQFKMSRYSEEVKVDLLPRFEANVESTDAGTYLYKIAKIVRALWLAERRVCMRVCKHGCDVKMFCFSRANHVSTNLKKFLSSKLDKVTLFTHSFVGWNLENLYKQAVSTFFRLSWHFKREKSVFWKASFCKTRTDYACKTSCTRLWDW